MIEVFMTTAVITPNSAQEVLNILCSGKKTTLFTSRQNILWLLAFSVF
jgi:hypothetical protein